MPQVIFVSWLAASYGYLVPWWWKGGHNVSHVSSNRKRKISTDIAIALHRKGKRTTNGTAIILTTDREQLTLTAI